MAPRPDAGVPGRRSLLLGAAVSGLVALLHVGILFGGAPWYRFFGAGERMARLASRGAPAPAVITLAIVIALATCSIYALSGAGAVRRLPFLRIVLASAAMVFLGRGVFGIPIVLLVHHPYANELRGRMTFMIVSSIVSFGLGLCYAVGVTRRWRTLRASV